MATIAVILTATMVVPAINMGALETAQNENYVYRATTTLGDYEYSLDTSNNLLLNGEIIDIDASHENNSDINVGFASATAGYSYRGTTSPSNWFYNTTAGIQNGSTPISIDSDGSWTAVKSGVTTTSTTSIEKGIFANNTGELAVYDAHNTSNVISINTNDSLYFFFNYCQCVKNDVTYGLSVLAEYKGGEMKVVYAYLVPGTGGTPTDVSETINVQIAFTSSELDEGVITFTGIHVSCGLDGYSIQGRGRLAAPLEYDAYVDSSYSPLLLVLPVMIILTVVVAAVRMFTNRD